MQTTAHTHTSETLSERSSNGISVALLWNRASDAATVVVHDEAADQEFVLHVGAGDNALDLFEHPYAYAAFRGIDLGCLETPREAVYA